MSDSSKIFARNLTARADYQTIGNPDISRPEDSVANCFPGLDVDLRNLDRRFFPGLVFEFISSGSPLEPDRMGALLLYPDGRGDSDLQPEYLDQLTSEQQAWIAPLRAKLHADLTGTVGRELAVGKWYLAWIRQGEKQINMTDILSDGSSVPSDGMTVWRLVRGLTPGEVSVGLRRRDADGFVKLKGWRRLFTSPRTGVLSRAYQPGELQMSMCSPWQHDFRDCACHYWASNRPDVVHPEAEPGEPALPGGTNPELANRRVDWMRADSSRKATAAVLSTLDANRPFQMDHFQINRTWQDLKLVLNNTEIGELYLPSTADTAKPYASPEVLYGVIRDNLAPLELTLVIEYLFARFSVVGGDAPRDPRWPDLGKHAEFVRHHLLLTAVSEMQHLRWANEVLWALVQADPSIAIYKPVLTPAIRVPIGKGESRNRALRSLTPEVLDQFIAVEEPSGTIDGAYARAVSTLNQPAFPRHLSDLVGRIVNDGVQHFVRFRDLKAVLSLYRDLDPPPYLRPLQLASNNVAKAALDAYQAILGGLERAYTAMSVGDFATAGAAIADTKQSMTTLLAEGEALAVRNLGIPFW
jgi:hypothetical protein